MRGNNQAKEERWNCEEKKQRKQEMRRVELFNT